MSHVRQQLREAFLARVKQISEVKTFTTARASPFAETELPAISVTTPRETIEFRDRTDDRMRSVAVDVTAYIVQDEAADDALDAIAARVEELVRTATGGVWDILWRHSAVSADLSIGDQAERSLFMLRTTFACDFDSSDAETIGA